ATRTAALRTARRRDALRIRHPLRCNRGGARHRGMERVTAPDAPKQWQKRPEAGSRLALWLWRTLAFKIGRRLTLVITFFAALYFMLRRGPERRASREYLRRVLGRRATLLEVFRHFLCFSTVTADRVFLMAERFSRFDVQIFGLERLDAALKEGRGTLLLGAHLGSFDALRVLSL